MQIEYLSSLDFGDETFTYKGSIHRYASVSGISFTATQTRHSVNGIPTGTSYETNLVLHMRGAKDLRIKQEYGFGGGAQKQRMEAIWRAKEIFSEITFAQRTAPYEADFEAKQFFRYGAYQFAKGGDVFRDGTLVLSLKDPGVGAALGPFELSISKKQSGLDRLKAAIFGNGIRVDLSRDRDCFLYMFREATGFSWPSEHYRVKRAGTHKEFLRALVALAAKLCVIDGEVKPVELAAFRMHFGMSSGQLPEATAVFNDALRSSVTASSLATTIRNSVSNQQEILEYVLVGLVMVAISDGPYNAHEAAAIAEVARAFGFSASALASLLMRLGLASGSDRQSDRASAGPLDAVFHFRVLGIEATLTPIAVREVYLTLVKRHHPDQLRGKGVPDDQIRLSENILKNVNVSYEWLVERGYAA